MKVHLSINELSNENVSHRDMSDWLYECLQVDVYNTPISKYGFFEIFMLSSKGLDNLSLHTFRYVLASMINAYKLGLLHGRHRIDKI